MAKTKKLTKAEREAIAKANTLRPPMGRSETEEVKAMPKRPAVTRLPPEAPMASPPSYKKGGKVKKTGMALVHKGERVMTRKQQRKMNGTGPNPNCPKKG